MADDILSPRQIIDDYGQKFIDALHASIEANDRLSGGLLFQSVSASVKVYGQKITLSISMEDYWKYVEEGRNPGSKQPPPNAMLKFIKMRGITPKLIAQNKGLKKGQRKVINKDAQYKSLAFLMGRSIKKKGIKPTHFASEVMEGSLMKQFEKELSDAVGRQIKIEIDKEVK